MLSCRFVAYLWLALADKKSIKDASGNHDHINERELKSQFHCEPSYSSNVVSRKHQISFLLGFSYGCNVVCIRFLSPAPLPYHWHAEHKFVRCQNKPIDPNENKIKNCNIMKYKIYEGWPWKHWLSFTKFKKKFLIFQISEARVQMVFLIVVHSIILFAWMKVAQINVYVNSVIVSNNMNVHALFLVSYVSNLHLMFILSYNYSKMTMTRTLTARLPWLIRTRFWVPRKFFR